MPTTPHGKNRSHVRPRTILLGSDQRGRDYLLKTETDPDTVVLVDGRERVLADQLDGLRVEHVVATVREEIGWATIEYGPDAHEKGCPRKYA